MFRLIGQVPLLFPIREGIEFRRFAAGLDEDVILIDHGIDPGHLIARKVVAGEPRLLQLGEHGVGQDGPTRTPGAGQAATGERVVGAADEQFAQRPGQVAQ